MQHEPLVGNPNQTTPLANKQASPSTQIPPAGAQTDILAVISTFNGEVNKNMQSLITEMQNLKDDFDTKVKYDESKERLIDSLHRELQTYREGLHFRILRPVFIDLIAMHDDLGKLIEDMVAKDSTSASSQMARNLGLFQEHIEEVLQRNGVEPFLVKENLFVASKQRILRVVDTPDPALDKQIAQRVRKGFEYEGKVLRPEIVATYRTVSS